MRVGFTGTREGMTPLQKTSLRKLFIDLIASELHHGDCVGADAEAHAIAQELGLRIIIHPPIDQSHRAFCEGAHEIRIPKKHFARNRDIVDETTYLTSASVTPHPLEHGGTWYTINYGRKKKDVYVVWPAGTVSLMLRKM